MKAVRESQLFGGCHGPALGPKGAIALNGETHRFSFGLGRGRVYKTHPVGRTCQSFDVKARAILGVREARPRPCLSLFHEPRPQRVMLDIANNRHQMLIVLNRKRFEPPLSNMSARMIIPYISSHVSG